MSTENEGPAVTPAAGPHPTQGDATPGGTPGAHPSPSPERSAASQDEGDFPLPEPAPQAGSDAHDAVTTAFGGPRDPARGAPQAPAPAGETEATAVLPPVGASAPPPVVPPPPGQAPQQQTAPQHQPPAPPQAPTANAAEPPGNGGQWGSGAAAPPPPPGAYGGGPADGGAGQGGQAGHGSGADGPQNPWHSQPAATPPGGRRRGPGALIAAVVVAALVAGGVGGGIGFWAADDDSSGSTTVSSTGDAGSKELNRSPNSVAGIADKALPSVVTIETGGGEGATGTGFVFDEEGHILTNNHVVAGAAGGGGKLTATFSDGKAYDAEVVGNAKGYDIAVIKLKNAGDRELSPLPLGDSDKMTVGDATIAIGAPFGLSGTVTTGIVSAQDRPVASSDGQSDDASYMNALQTDASINPGNSGGPLLNAKGDVIGVNSAIRGSDGGMGQGQSGSIGLGFAIPVNQAKRVATQLIETGVPVYPMIGVRVDRSEQGRGAPIVDNDAGGGEAVTKGGPADKAGLRPGDRITELGGRAIDSGPTLIATIWSHEPGETVKVKYERNGKESTTDLTLGSQKGDG
ncbi:trypsin-like peptidase domain-containing protein [Streptomyces sp. NPDC054784]